MKKRVFILLSALSLMLIFAVTASAFIAGDTDNDFLITASDARFALRLSVDLEECDPESDQYKAADTNGDGKVTSADARTILRVSVGLESFKENTEKNQGILITKMPYKTNGLVINSIKTEDNYYVLSITNKTGNKEMAVAESTRIPYKMYNSAGDVIKSDYVYVSQMNNGESCTEKIRKVDNAAKLIFGAATIKLTEAAVVIPTEKIGGIEVSKAPFKVEGITINDIILDTEKRTLYVDMTNNTGASASASVRFNTYDAKGNSLGNISVSMFTIANGEKLINYTYFPAGTAKITVYEVNAYKSEDFTPVSTKTSEIQGLTVTKMPLNASGLSFSVVGVESTYSGAPILNVKVTNNTGKAIDGNNSYFYYKSYDESGYVLSLYSQRILSLNAGESFVAELSLPIGAKKVLFGEITVKEGVTLDPGKTAVVNGITTNIASPFNGLQVSDIQIKKYSNSTEISFKITNKSGKTVHDYAEILYKVLSSDNTVIKTSSTYTGANLNNNENIYKIISVPGTDVSKLYFFPGEVKEGITIKDSASYQDVGGVKITSAPFAAAGLKIESYRYEDGKIYVKIRNNTGSAVSASSYFSYKAYDASGNVLRESMISCNQMNKDETCEVSFYIPTDAAKITIHSAKVYN